MPQDCPPHSSFPHHSKAGCAPSQLKQAEIVAILQSCREVLQNLDATRRVLMHIIDTNEARLRQPPIHSIPAEVIQEIFQHCLPTNHLPIMSSSEAPILLTQVCRLWRSLALSSPRLWGAVHIPLPSSRFEPFFDLAFETRLETAKWWLTNACQSGYPLTISLYWPKALPLRYTYGKREDFARLVTAASHNIRELDLDLPYDNLQILLNTLPTSFPRLEKVTLRRGREIEDARLWEAPSLRKVVWDEVGGDILRTQLKWDVLEEVRVVGESDRSWFKYEDATALLQATRKNIIHLGIQRAEVNDDVHPRHFGPSFLEAIQGARIDAARNAPLSLPRLETLDLVVDTCRPHFVPRLYGLLQLPAVRTLSYATHRTVLCPHSQAEPHPLLTLLSGQRQPTSITTFIVDASSMSRSTFLDCLKLLPPLERLWVKDGRSIDLESLPMGDSGTPPIGNPDEEIVLDNELLIDLLCSLTTHLRFDRAHFSLGHLKKYILIRVALATSFSSTCSDEEAAHVAKLRSVQVGLVYQMPDGWSQSLLGSKSLARGKRYFDPSSESDFGYKLQELGVSVNVAFAVKCPDAGESQETLKVADPRDGLRAFDEWIWL